MHKIDRADRAAKIWRTSINYDISFEYAKIIWSDLNGKKF